jgi:hypothetical protein
MQKHVPRQKVKTGNRSKWKGSLNFWSSERTSSIPFLRRGNNNNNDNIINNNKVAVLVVVVVMVVVVVVT